MGRAFAAGVMLLQVTLDSFPGSDHRVWGWSGNRGGPLHPLSRTKQDCLFGRKGAVVGAHCFQGGYGMRGAGLDDFDCAIAGLALGNGIPTFQYLSKSVELDPNTPRYERFGDAICSSAKLSLLTN